MGRKKAETARKVRVTVQLPATLASDVRDCVVALSATDKQMTISGLTEVALVAELERRQEDNEGEPFPPRSEEVKTGRPHKS